MIKINLLGITQPQAQREEGPSPTPVRQALYFVIGAVVSGVVVFSFWAYWNREISNLTKELEKQKIEAQRLATIRAENQRYVAQVQQLQRRQTTIQQLANSRSGPVDLMINVGNIVNRADDVYILTMIPEGARITIKGQANTVHSIANLITNLKGNTAFQDVQLRQYFQDDQYDRLSFKFNIDFVYKPPAATPPPSPGPQQAAGPAAPARPAGQ